MAKRISRRKLFGAARGAALAAPAGCAFSRRLKSPKEPPNTVLIVADAFRADRLGALRDGASIIPNLDAFARNAALYQECCAPCPRTKTSMASIPTGTYPPLQRRSARTAPSRRTATPSPTCSRETGTPRTACRPTRGWPPRPPRSTRTAPRSREYGFHKGFDMETHQPWTGFLPGKFAGAYCSRRNGRSQGAVFNHDQKLVRKTFSVPGSQVSEGEQRRLHGICDEAGARRKDELIFAQLRPPAAEDADSFEAEASRLVRDYAAFAGKHNVVAAETSARRQRLYQDEDKEAAADKQMTEEEKRLTEQLKALGYFNN